MVNSTKRKIGWNQSNLMIPLGYDSIFKGLFYLLLLAGIFFSSFTVMIKWWGNEDFSYCYLVGPIVLYLIWEKRKRFASVPSQPNWNGILPLALGLTLFWLGELGGEFYTIYFASWLVLFGICWMHLGWEKLKIIWFPIVFLIAMFPPPNFVNFPLTLKLKLISSQLGVAVMQAYGLSVYREGNIIDLGFTQLQVVDACSGLRFLYPLFIMGILLTYFYKSRLWKKILIVISTVPLTIVTNSLRIAMTGILFELWGPEVAEGFFHGFSGWFIFMFGLAVLVFEMWALNGFRMFRFSGSLSSSKEDSEIEPNSASKISGSKPDAIEKLMPQTPNLKPQPQRGFRAFFQPSQFVAAVILLGATLLLAQGVEFREKIPMSRSFAEFPLKLGDWDGRRNVMQQKILETLDLSDYVIVDYWDRDGKQVNFYTAYYQSQRKGESIHSPETCLPGSGWVFKNAGGVTLPLKTPNHKPMRVNRAFMEKGAFRQLSYFWFPQRDRVLTNAYELKLYNFWDALTRQRTDGALVRVITPIYDNEDLADAEKRLQSFTQTIVPVLNEFLPD